MAMRGFTMKRFSLALILMASVASANDVQIDGGANNTNARGMRNSVCVSSSVCYVFGITNSTHFSYFKTTDGGATWGSAVDIASAAAYIAYDVWYDQWTPSDSGTLIHTWYFEATNDKVFWRSLDTSSDTLGTERTAFTGASAVAGRGAFCSGTKSRSGYLYVAFDIDAGAEHGIVRSTDSGTTWSANLATTFVEATIDEAMLFPATGTGDNNDIWAIYQDSSADQLTMKMWDSSAVAEVESSSMQTMIESTSDLTGQRGFNGAIRKSDGHLIVVSFSEADTATEDFQAWDVSAVNAGSLTGITALTDITTNIDDMYYPGVYIDPNNNIYVAYIGKRDGSETFPTTIKVYYTKSTDGGTTWSSGDTTYMENAASSNRHVLTPLSGSRFFATFTGATGLTTQTNYNNSVAFTNITPNGFLQLMTPGN